MQTSSGELQHVAQRRSSTIEETLFELNGLAPEVMKTLPSLFREAVLETLRSLSHSTSSRELLASLNHIDLGERFAVFRALDCLYGERARSVEQAIDIRFESDVLRLVGRALMATPSL